MAEVGRPEGPRTFISDPKVHRFSFKNNRCAKMNLRQNFTLSIHTFSTERKDFINNRLLNGSIGKPLIVDYKTVSCGGHKSNTCENCPQGKGRAWCNGDCSWCSDSYSCKLLGECSMDGQYFFHSLILIPSGS